MKIIGDEWVGEVTSGGHDTLRIMCGQFHFPNGEVMPITNESCRLVVDQCGPVITHWSNGMVTSSHPIKESNAKET